MADTEEEFTAPDGHLDPDERDIEAPADDAVEQATVANPADAPTEVHRGLEVGEYDAVEQARVVDLDDDYR
ncbi:MAG TPA: hypothetical protein VFE14_16875 [Micromonosporaceae bacterium]|jgi:hypothetical protein|nr:hypothetical protein [Micromonosporaceae bacterium]